MKGVGPTVANVPHVICWAVKPKCATTRAASAQPWWSTHRRGASHSRPVLSVKVENTAAARPKTGVPKRSGSLPGSRAPRSTTPGSDLDRRHNLHPLPHGDHARPNTLKARSFTDAARSRREEHS
jgi:hypothetical protein